MPSLHVSEAPRNNWSDDEPLEFGGVVKLLYETADANANVLTLVFPEGGATDVPGLVIGDASIENVDLGWFNGLTEPFIAIVNDAADAYVRLDAGDDAVAGSKGLYYKAAADEDIELENLSVTGTPRRYWDESQDMYRTTKGWIIDAKGLFIGTTANANQTIGITIDRGASGLGEGIALKDSANVNHEMSTITEVDTIAFLKERNTSAGGLQIYALLDATGSITTALELYGILGVAADTTKTTAGVGVIQVNAATKSGTGKTDIGANGNLVTISNNGTTRFIFDAEGSGHGDVEWVAFDKFDDMALVAELEAELQRREDKGKTERRHALERVGIIGANSWHFENGKPRAVVNFTKLAMLHHGTLLQLYGKLKLLEQRVATNEAKLLEAK